MDDKQRIADAVNLLIASPNYATTIREIRQIIDNWDTHPMAFSGSLAPLNALIDVGLEKRTAFDRLVELIESKRRLVPALKRTDYQRSLMADRRRRLSKAVELQELLIGKLAPPKRKAFEADITKRWAAAKKDYITSKGDLDWKGRNAATQEFWDRIDEQLEANIQAERAKKHRK